MKKTSLLVAVGISMLLFQGCVTRILDPQEPHSPPAVKLGNFNQVQLEKATIDPTYEGNGANQKAVAKIDELMEQKMKTVFPKLNQKSNDDEKNLLIKPHVEAIKFIGGMARFWTGPLSGSSAVILRMDYIDKSTGKVIASPLFYEMASAMGGAWSFGGTDNGMLHRIVTDAVEYSQANR